MTDELETLQSLSGPQYNIPALTRKELFAVLQPLQFFLHEQHPTLFVPEEDTINEEAHSIFSNILLETARFYIGQLTPEEAIALREKAAHTVLQVIRDLGVTPAEIAEGAMDELADKGLEVSVDEALVEKLNEADKETIN